MKIKNIRQKIKWIFIGFGIFFGMIILSLIGFRFYIETSHGQKFAQSVIDKKLPGSIEWQDMAFSITGGYVEMQNVVLKNPVGEKLAGFSKLVLDIAYSTLFKGDLTVVTFLVEEPTADIVIDQNGRLNLLDAFPSGSSPKEPSPRKPGSKPPLNIVVDSMKIENGSIRFTSMPQKIDARFSGIDLDASGNVKQQSGALLFHVEKSNFNSPKASAETKNIRLKTAVADGKVEPLEFIAETPSSSVELSGKASEIFTSPQLDIGLDIIAALPEIREILKLKPEFTGQISLNMTVNGGIDNPDADLKLNYDGGVIAGHPVDRIEWKSRLEDRKLTIEQMLVEVFSGNVTGNGVIDMVQAFPEGLLSQNRDLQAVSYRLNVTEDRFELATLLRNSEGLQGTIKSEITVDGKGVMPETLDAAATIRIEGDQLSSPAIASPVDFVFNTEAALKEGVLILETLDAGSAHLDLKAAGRLEIPSKSMNFDVSLDAPDLFRLLSLADIRNVHGGVNLTAKISGDIENPVGDVVLDARNIRVADITIGDIDLTVALDASGNADISELALENQGSTIQATGNIPNIIYTLKNDFENITPNVSMTLKNLQAKHFVARDIAEGVLDGRIEMSGPLKNLDATIFLDGKNIRTPAAAVGDLDAKMRLSGGKLAIDQLIIHNRKSDIKLVGQAQILETNTVKPLADPEFDIDLVSENLYVQDFVKDYQGKISIKANGRGRLSKPEGAARIEARELDLGVQKINSLDLVSEFNKQRVTISNFNIAITKDDVLNGTGWYAFDRSFNIEMSSKGIALTHIDQIRRANVATGVVTLDIRGQGDLNDPRLDGTIGLTQLTIMEKPVEDFKVTVSLADQVAKLTGKLNFDIEADYHLKNKAFSATVALDNTHLDPYFKMANQADLTGRISGAIKAKGNADQPEAAEITADITDLNLFYQGNELLQTKGVKAFIKDRRFEVSTSGFRLLKDGRLMIEGRGDLTDTVFVKADGEIPVNVVSAFAKDLPKIDGKVQISALVEGKPSMPVIDGTILLNDIGMTVPTLNQQLHGLNGKIRITDTSVKIENFSGRLDDGRFDLSGAIALKSFQPQSADLSLKAHALALDIPGTMTASFNSNLSLSGTPNQSKIKGEIVLLDGRYYKNFNLNLKILESVATKKRATSPTPKKADIPYVRNVQLDILVTHRNPYLVENNLANMKIVPDMRIRGTLEQPVVNGRAEVESGTITYQGKNFVVKKGLIDFINPYKIEPTLDIVSQVDIRQWQVTLSISGTPEALKFKLSSQPPEDDADLLSLLLIGKTSRELAEGTSTSNQTPAQMLAEIVGNQVGGKIKGATGLDILEVEVNGEKSGEQESDRVKVTIGKELSRRMTVKYSVESKDGEMVRRTSTEYKFLENLLLSGFQDSKGDFGGELLFRLEFR